MKRRQFIHGVVVYTVLGTRSVRAQPIVPVVGFLAPGSAALTEIVGAFRQGLARVAKSNITTVPVVFYMGEDPVSLGVVQSFNRPGGNLTGVATLSSAVMAKRMELLNELVPRAEVFAVL